LAENHRGQFLVVELLVISPHRRSYNNRIYYNALLFITLNGLLVI
jgi:hypothetical protein